jgi:hypothetical protein
MVCTAVLHFTRLRYVYSTYRGYVVAQLAEALHSNPEGRGFDSRLLNPSGHTPAPKGNKYQEYLLEGGGVKVAGA